MSDKPKWIKPEAIRIDVAKEREGRTFDRMQGNDSETETKPEAKPEPPPKVYKAPARAGRRKGTWRL